MAASEGQLQIPDEFTKKWLSFTDEQKYSLQDIMQYVISTFIIHLQIFSPRFIKEFVLSFEFRELTNQRLQHCHSVANKKRTVIK